MFQQAGLGQYTNDDTAGVLGWFVVGVNVVGLVVAITLAVPRLRAHRTAFWVPLVVGLACVLLTTVLLVAAAVTDPAFSAALDRAR